MDETDSRYAMVPPLTFTHLLLCESPYAVPAAASLTVISFSTDPYNPLGAYFTLQAQKLVTQVAVLTHLQSISKGLEQPGRFLPATGHLEQAGRLSEGVDSGVPGKPHLCGKSAEYRHGHLPGSQGGPAAIGTGPGRTRENRLVHEAGLSQPEKFSGIGIHSRISPLTSGTVSVRCWAVSIRPPRAWIKPRIALTNSRESNCINNSRAIISAWPNPRSCPRLSSPPRRPPP